MPPSGNGKSRTKNSAQRRLDFDVQNTTTSDGAILIEDDTPQTSKPSDSVSSPRKRSPVSSFESPAPSKKSKAAAVTPEADKEDLSKFVPSYLHKNVEYCREGKSTLSSKTVHIFKWICDRYEIPSDFEQQRSFGPLSGTTFEQRVIGEYTLGKLHRKKNAPDGDTMICLACAETDHVRDNCPTLI